MRTIKTLILATTVFFSQLARSEPTDLNEGGPFAGAQLALGQSKKVGNSSAGPAYLALVDFGYVIKRDTWNRLEVGLELGTGNAITTDKTGPGNVKVTLDLDSLAGLRLGYGYSLGDHAFGLLRVTAGLAQASYKGKLNGTTIDGGTASGLAYSIGWDTVVPATPKMDLLFGANLRRIAFSFDDLAEGEVQLNLPTLYAGARYKL